MVCVDINIESVILLSVIQIFLIELNISAYHHCIRDSRIAQRGSGLWVAIACDFDLKPERAVVEDKFRAMLLPT